MLSVQMLASFFPVVFNGLKSADSEAAVDHNHLPGRIREITSAQRSNRASDILDRSPALLEGEALRDQFIILLGDPARHISLYDAGPDLENIDSVLRQPNSPKLGRHADAGFRYRVLAAIRRGEGSRNG